MLPFLKSWLSGKIVPESQGARNFSIEFTITGRNDNYEPHWNERLRSVLKYNHALFNGSGIQFRAAFVEWNPPEGKPLLSPGLVRDFPYLRAVVVDRRIHQDLCESEEIAMMLNFGYNAAIRTSKADFSLISGGDIFLGSDVREWLVTKGLHPRCLYRAVRIDIRNDLDFENAEKINLENKKNRVRVNKVGKEPYTNACGDFILMDRGLFHEVRGYDENIRFARVGLDGRCCLSALALGAKCKLIGNIYHIDHSRSLSNSAASYPGKQYNYRQGIPYRNPDDWGLQNRRWEKKEERLDYVT